MNTTRKLTILLVGLNVLLSQMVNAAGRALFQDELVRESDAIALVEIYGRAFPNVTGSLESDDQTQMGLILYQAKIIQTLLGSIPTEPFIIQFDGYGDMNALDKGKYLIFFKAEGRLFRPLSTEFRIADDKVFWFKQPFITGDLGPIMGDVPLQDVIREVKDLIRKYKES